LILVDRTVPAGELARVRRFVREPEALYAARKDVLQQVKDHILAADGRAVRRVILFGSRARGDARPDSDYDVLVLVSGRRGLRPQGLQHYLVGRAGAKDRPR
jgi:predicted nucleotidyltransferase